MSLLINIRKDIKSGKYLNGSTMFTSEKNMGLLHRKRKPLKEQRDEKLSS